MIHSILRDKSTRLYIILGAFFVSNALIAEMIGVKTPCHTLYLPTA
jgi:hypothetical protein